MYRLFFLTILINFNIFATENFSHLESYINFFQEKCINDENALANTYIDELQISCGDLHKDLETDIPKYEEHIATLDSQNENCYDSSVNINAFLLSEQMNSVTNRVSCNEQELKKQKKKCGETFACNTYRSLNYLADGVLPGPLRRSTKKYVLNKVREKKYSPECLENTDSNCLQEVITSIQGSFFSTVDAVKSIATGAYKKLKSLFGAEDVINKAGTALLHAGTMTVNEVKSFATNPVDYMVTMMENIKDSVDYWLKNTVFCQRWEGEPHLSKCLNPLSNFDCLNCEDRINATCAGIGTLISEAGMVFLTAGVGNFTALGTKIGVGAMRSIARKTASKIAKKSPTLANAAKHGNKSKAFIAGEVVGTQVIAQNVRIGAQKLKDSIDGLKAFAQRINQSKLARGVAKTLDIVSDPLRLTAASSRAGANVSNRIITGITKSRTMTNRSAKIALGLNRKAKTNTRIRRMLQKRDRHTGKVVATRGIRISKRYSDHSSGKGGSTHPDTATGNNHNSDTPRTNRDQTRRETAQSDNRNTDRRNEERRREKERELERERIAQEDKKKKDHSNEEEKESASSHLGNAALATAVNANAANRISSGYREDQKRRAALEKAFNEDIKEIGTAELENSNAQVNSDSDLKEKLGFAKDSNPSQQQINNKLNNLSNSYNEANRSSFVEQLANSGVSRDKANKYFNNRRAQIESAKNYMNNYSASNSEKLEIQKLLNDSKALEELVESYKKDDDTPIVKKEDVSRLNPDVKEQSIENRDFRTSPSASQNSNFTRNDSSIPTSRSVSSSGSSNDGNLTSESSSNNEDNNLDFNEDETINDIEKELLTQTRPVEEEASSDELSDLLNILKSDNVDLHAQVLVRILENQISSNGEQESVLKKNFLQALKKYDGVAKVKITYKLDSKKLDVYEFSDGQKYSLISTDDKQFRVVKTDESREFISKVLKE